CALMVSDPRLLLSPSWSDAVTVNPYVPGVRLNDVVYVQSYVGASMLIGETRNEPAVTPMPHVPSAPRFSRVVVLRRVIVTCWSRSSPAAVPEKVSLPPGATTTGCTVNGGVICTGVLMLTVGATAVVLTSQSRTPLRRSACPASSIAVALPRHVPSCGSVTV